LRGECGYADSDELEQQLRENLKLRRELAAEVAKAKGTKTASGGTVGWVLYWACVGVSVFLLVVWVGRFFTDLAPGWLW